ncbi:unnamed protein product [Meloidogyne enterolobii]|uniref:Uncharacterized protein n=1 Tax=Meloidogyne enterolobii TaxID=390850 RepID=A0ACB0ZCQ8_MELEN
MSHPYKSIKLKSGVFEFTLNDQLREKWQAALTKPIPLFLHNFEPSKKFISITTVDRKTPYLLNLPKIPKKVKEMVYLRGCLEQLFKCSFEYVNFYKSIFNPEMINILFDNDKTIPHQFNINDATLFANNETFKNVLKFSLNHLSISESLTIDLKNVGITEQHTNILFIILINKGNKLPKISLESLKLTNLHDLISEVSRLKMRTYITKFKV